MKKCFKFLFIAGLLFLVFGCDDDDKHVAEPISPILKEIKIPNETDIIPGQPTQISGLGFAREDKLLLTGAEGTLEVEVLEVTDSYIKFTVPVDAGGEYTVTIERAGKQTALNSTLKVPFVVPLTDVELPKGGISQEGEVYIVAKGFEAGDVARITAGIYTF